MGRRARLSALATTATLALACDVSTGAPPSSPARVSVPPAEEAAAAGASSQDIPIRLAGDNEAAVMVPVRVNGEALDLVLDTGATLTCFDAAVADRLGLEAWPNARGFAVGVQGRSGRLRLVRVDSLSIGATTAYDLMACVLDLEALGALGENVQGLLGLNALKPFRVVMDFPAGTLRLEATGD